MESVPTAARFFHCFGGAVMNLLEMRGVTDGQADDDCFTA